MIKASSLYYAVMICVLVGISCVSFLMISYYSKMHSILLETQTELFSVNESATNYFLGNIEGLTGESEKIDVLENGMPSEATISQWGFYKVLNVSTFFKNDTLKKQSLLGVKNTNRTALYLTDTNKSLQMIDKAKIIGDVYIPKKGIKKGHIGPHSFSSFKFLEGKKYTSATKLPNIDGVFTVPQKAVATKLLMEEIKDNETLYNSFEKEVLEIVVTESNFNHKNILGNIIIRATDSLFIKKDNILEDVLIIAPKVVFERGFKGAVQVMAEAGVTLQEEVILKYPSGIFIADNTAEKIEVVLEENAKLLGSIVVTASVSKNKGISLVSILKNAIVIGTLYSNGGTDLKGKVIGSVFTNTFYLKTKAASYENYIQDGVIDREAFPNFFLGSTCVINKASKNNYGIIKTL